MKCGKRQKRRNELQEMRYTGSALLVLGSALWLRGAYTKLFISNYTHTSQLSSSLFCESSDIFMKESLLRSSSLSMDSPR